MGVSKYQKKQLANAAFYIMNQSRNDTLMLVLVSNTNSFLYSSQTRPTQELLRYFKSIGKENVNYSL